MKYRNHVAQNPLLRKGGAHQKSRSSQRSTNRRKLNSYLDEWYEDEHNEKSNNKGIKEEQDSSSFFCHCFYVVRYTAEILIDGINRSLNI